MSLSEKIIEYKDLGAIIIKKSPNTKRISISVRPFEGIRVTIPVLVSFKKAERFIEQKESWLRRTISNVRDMEKSYSVFDDDTQFNTKDHTLEIIRTEGENPEVILKNSKISVYVPGTMDIREKKIQEMIRRGIEAAWRKEAQIYLPARTGELARLHGFRYKKVIIKNNRTRWGSCSEKNNINLSLHLMRLPEYLCDYVLLHELVHTVHKNHSKQFWKLLDILTGDAKVLDKELKNYRIDIY